MSTLAGGVNGANGFFVDATGSNAGFNFPYGVAVDANGTVFVSDSGNNRIRKVTPVGGTHIGPISLRPFFSAIPFGVLVSRCVNALLFHSQSVRFVPLDLSFCLCLPVY